MSIARGRLETWEPRAAHAARPPTWRLEVPGFWLWHNEGGRRIPRLFLGVYDRHD